MPDKGHLDNWFEQRKLRRASLTSEALYDKVYSGDKQALSSAITLIESERPADKLEANKLVSACYASGRKSFRLGITGVPGVGKSSFIEAFGKLLLEAGKKVAVLAIDPSSQVTGGSILGDKTRMNWLSQQENVFIRPTPAGKSLGGVARATRESIVLCEAAGYDIVIVETVGVGQSETLVSSMVDFFLLLMLSGAGDELQGIKRGIMEMADALLITKADGENELKAKRARSQYASALHLFPQKENNWTPYTSICSSVSGKGLSEFMDVMMHYFVHIQTTGWWAHNRRKQEIQLLRDHFTTLIIADFFENEQWKSAFEKEVSAIESDLKSGYQAAEDLLKQFRS